MSVFRKKSRFSFDPATQEPVIRKSICTGELTAGFLDKKTGKFQEHMRIKNPEEFEKLTGVSQIRIIY